jgi:hypothetical protein
MVDLVSIISNYKRYNWTAERQVAMASPTPAGQRQSHTGSRWALPMRWTVSILIILLIDHQQFSNWSWISSSNSSQFSIRFASLVMPIPSTHNSSIMFGICGPKRPSSGVITTHFFEIVYLSYCWRICEMPFLLSLRNFGFWMHPFYHVVKFLPSGLTAMHR